MTPLHNPYTTMLLFLLIVFILLNTAVAGFLATHALASTDPPVRRGYWLFAGLLIVDAAAFLTIYSLYTNGLIR